MEPKNELIEEQDEAISDGYKKAYEDLTQNKGYTARKAKRYLDSIAKRNYKKFMKNRNKTVKPVNPYDLIPTEEVQDSSLIPVS